MFSWKIVLIIQFISVIEIKPLDKNLLQEQNYNNLFRNRGLSFVFEYTKYSKGNIFAFWNSHTQMFCYELVKLNLI